MLSSITPLGERGRQHQWWATFAWYLAGSILGGLLVGSLFGLLGTALVSGLTPTVRAVAVAGIVLVAGLIDLSGKRLPSVHRQVNEVWLDEYRRWIYAGGFGLQLGTGIVTIVTTATVYATWLVAGMSGSIVAGALVGVVFGASRALPLLTVRSVDDPGKLRTTHRVMQQLAPAASRAVVVGCAVLAAVGIGIGITT